MKNKLTHGKGLFHLSLILVSFIFERGSLLFAHTNAMKVLFLLQLNRNAVYLAAIKIFLSLQNKMKSSHFDFFKQLTMTSHFEKVKHMLISIEFSMAQKR